MNYDYGNMMPNLFGSNPVYMDECMYPMGYHDMYGHMYPMCMEPNINGGMVYPIMYPDIYYKLYPYISRVCDRMDNPYLLYPSEELLGKMVDEAYDMCMNEMPELEEYANAKAVDTADNEAQQVVRRIPIFRDVITLILLSELFRRRRGPGLWY